MARMRREEKIEEVRKTIRDIIDYNELVFRDEEMIGILLSEIFRLQNKDIVDRLETIESEYRELTERINKIDFRKCTCVSLL